MKVLIYCDTLQFSPFLFINCQVDSTFWAQMLQHLLTNNRYFSRSLKEIRCVFPNIIMSSICKISSLETFCAYPAMRVQGRIGISNSNIKLLASNIPTLRTLELCHQQSAWVQQQCLSHENGLCHLSNFTSLQSLTLRDCDVTDKTLVETISKMYSLRVLNLIANPKISSVGCSSLASLLTRKQGNLRELSLSSSRMDDDAVIALCTGGARDDEDENEVLLRKLTMRGIPNITDKSIEIISNKMPHLRELDVSACQHLTEGALESIAKNLVNLETFSAYRNNSMINDATLKILFEQAGSTLRSLDIRYCSSVTARGLEAVVDRMKCLEELMVSIEVSDLGFLCEKLPSLKIL